MHINICKHPKTFNRKLYALYIFLLLILTKMGLTGDEMAERSESHWRKAMIGPLPEDFLRVTNVQGPNNKRRLPVSQFVQFIINLIQGITCAQAKLVRNYGITRMDPYVRIRVGHYVYETQTDPNGGKNPRWNRVIQSQLPAGVNSIYVEIYDECNFKMDELIAWCEIKVPERVLLGETHEQWYSLSGKQGEGLEGAIDVVLSFCNQPMPSYMYQAFQMPSPLLMVPSVRSTPVYVTSQPPMPPQAAPAQVTESELQQIKEMFPNIETDVVKTVFEANRGDKDATINSLLQLNE
uniref:CUE domain-containing protein n=1 Tax=Glossina austeni TaxID=7395 RepID=A0A1A9VR69_GLOAU